MSPNNPGNFVNDLVEMASAFKRLPEIEAELEQVRRDADVAHAMTADREEAILRYKAEIETLHSRIRTLEVDRDHAETMFLEADDRTSRALDFIKATFGNAGSLIQALEPARPVEPVTEQLYKANAPTAEPEGLHTTQPTTSFAHTTAPLDGPESPVSFAPPAPEVAPARPTETNTTAFTLNSESTPLGSHTSPVGADASTATSSSTELGNFTLPAAFPGRYVGRCYSEVIASGDYPNREQWEANGGTVDNWFA